MACRYFHYLSKKIFPSSIGCGLSIAAFFIIFYLVPVSSCYSASATAQNKGIGINLTWVKDWTSELVFTDHFKRARQWTSNNRKHPLAIDEHGWVKKLDPGQTAQSYIFAGFKDHFPSQEFTILFDGNGEIQFPEATIIDKKPGQLRIRLHKNVNTLSLLIKKTDPKNYIRNIRIYSGHVIPTTTFRADFLNRWQPFSAIRFMGWMETNNSTQKNWQDRPQTDDFSQATHKGVALEYMIELANTLNISPWFSIPHQTSNDYVRKFATMVRNKLNPNLKVYIEYSNEVWNGSFQQYHYASQKGAALHLSEHDYLVPLRFYSQRSVEIFKIWTSVFHGHERLVRILSGQAVVPYMTKQILEWQDAWKYADAFAIGNYFGLQNNKLISQSPDEKELNSLMWLDLKKRLQLVQQHQKITSEKHIMLFAYEGGQGLVARNKPVLNKLFDQSNRGAQMRSLYKKHFANWFKAGGNLFMHYSSVVKSSKYGRWGLLEWYDQKTKNTKYSTLLEIQKQLSSSH